MGVYKWAKKKAGGQISFMLSVMVRRSSIPDCPCFTWVIFSSRWAPVLFLAQAISSLGPAREMKMGVLVLSCLTLCCFLYIQIWFWREAVYMYCISSKQNDDCNWYQWWKNYTLVTFYSLWDLIIFVVMLWIFHLLFHACSTKSISGDPDKLNASNNSLRCLMLWRELEKFFI